MKNKSYMFNFLLAVVWGIVLAAALIGRTVYPAIVLLPLDIPLLQAVSLLVLLAEYWIVPGAPRSWGILTLLAALTIGLLPLCAGFVSCVEALKLGAAGGMTCVLSAVLFDSVMHRISDAGGTKFAQLFSVLILFLGGQCLTNVFF